MVSAKTNEANNQSGIVRNKDGSIRKPSGRKQKLRVDQLNVPGKCRGSLSEGNLSLTNNVLNRNSNIRVEEEEQIQDLNRTALDETAVTRLMETQFNEINSLNNRFDDFRNEIRGLFHAANSLPRVQPLNTDIITIQSENDKTNLTRRQSTKSSPIEYEIPRSLTNQPMSSRGSNDLTEICGYKMKINKFNGGEDEDYDVWWEDLLAFFRTLYFHRKR
jgi:hypothetical protein